MSVKVGYDKKFYNQLVANQNRNAMAGGLGMGVGALLGGYMRNQQMQRRQQANAPIATQLGLPADQAGNYDQKALLQMLMQKQQMEAERKQEEYRQQQMMERDRASEEAAMARLLAGNRGDMERARYGHESDARIAQINAQRAAELEKLRTQGDVLQNYRKASMPMTQQDQALTEYRRAATAKLQREATAGGDPTKMPAGMNPQTMEMANRIGLQGVGPGALANLTLPQQQELLAKRISGQMSDADIYKLLGQYMTGIRTETAGNIFGLPADPRVQGVTGEIGRRLQNRGFPVNGGAPAPGTTQGITPPEAGGVNIKGMTPQQKQALRDLLDDDLMDSAIDEADTGG